MPRRVSLPGASELFRPTRTDEPAQPVIREQPERQVPDTPGAGGALGPGHAG